MICVKSDIDQIQSLDDFLLLPLAASTESKHNPPGPISRNQIREDVTGKPNLREHNVQQSASLDGLALSTERSSAGLDCDMFDPECTNHPDDVVGQMENAVHPVTLRNGALLGAGKGVVERRRPQHMATVSQHHKPGIHQLKVETQNPSRRSPGLGTGKGQTEYVRHMGRQGGWIRGFLSLRGRH